MTNLQPRFIRGLLPETIDSLLRKDLFAFKLMPDIKSGVVFPAIRNNYIEFYYRGGLLFKYQNGQFSTHFKYAFTPKPGISNYLTEKQLQEVKHNITFIDAYNAIKERCDLYSALEASGVSSLYSFAPYNRKSKEIFLLDIEIAFSNQKSIDEENENKDKTKTDRIDILIYNNVTRSLLFCEVKHFSNKEIWSNKNTKPKVVSQIAKYNQQIEARKQEILEQYRIYINQVNQIFHLSPILNQPEKIISKTALLIFGFDRNQQSKIKELLTNDGSLDQINHYEKGDIQGISIDTLFKKVGDIK